MKRISLRPGDWLILLLSLVLTVAMAAYAYGGRNEPGFVRISNGTHNYIYPLNEDRVLVVEGILGPSEVVIADGQVRMKSAPCPEQLCVHSPPISRPGESIVCLPGRIMISIEHLRKEEHPDDTSAW